MNKIKVVHLQTHLPSSGNAARRLHDALRTEGIDSRMLSLTSDVAENDEITRLGKWPKVVGIINQKLEGFLTRNAVKEFGYFSYPLLGTDVSKHTEIQRADLIYLHWAIGGFLNLDGIEKLCRLSKPIIIFMHDMWTITGGCHHSFTCDKFSTGCHRCQVFNGSSLYRFAEHEFRRKLKLYAKFNNLFFVAPSMWLYNLAKASLLTVNKPIFYIPNLIDNTLYKPIEKSYAKHLLNVDPDDLILGFGAISIDSPYKGWLYLQEALALLANKLSKIKGISVLVFGSGYNKDVADSIPFKTKFLGRLRDDLSTAIVYNAIDIMITPSTAEAFGLVILEALSCGTPVVAFNVGGIPDLILHKINGYLAAYKDSKDLAVGIEYCVDNNIKGYPPEKFAKLNTITKHLQLYETIGISC